MTSMLFDSHCHIHDRQFYPEGRQPVYDRAVRADVSMLCIGTDQADSRAAVEFVQDRDRAWAVVGVHPHDTKGGIDDIGVLLSEMPEKVVGIGEIGLDYYYGHSPRLVQIDALEQQLQWASDYHLPVSFHVRDAFEDFWPVWRNFSGIRGVLHSFTDTADNLERALAAGLYIGVNGISTFTRDFAQQQMFASIPLEKILLETDAPFLTPIPLRGKVNEPSYVGRVAEHVAAQRDVSLDTVAATTTDNTRRLFAI